MNVTATLDRIPATGLITTKKAASLIERFRRRFAVIDNTKGKHERLPLGLLLIRRSRRSRKRRHIQLIGDRPNSTAVAPSRIERLAKPVKKSSGLGSYWNRVKETVDEVFGS